MSADGEASQPTAADPTPSRWRRWLPFFGFWQGRRVALADLLAGLTVGLVLVPQAMAYAALAGVPPINGLYAASFACIAGGLFGRCGQLQTGPVAMTALLSYAAVQPLAAPGGEDYLALMAVLAILVGVMRIAIGLLRGTALVSLISKPVLSGFATAAGITIAATQVPQLFLIDPGLANPILNSLAILPHLLQAHLPSVAMGLGTLAAMILFKRFAPRWPGLLISLAAAGMISHLSGFAAAGGRVIGELPAGLPPLALPSQGWSAVPDLVVGALMVVVIGLLEVMTVTSTVERRLGQRTDLDQEMLGQGAASLVAGCTGGFPVSGSLSRSALNLLAGARTGLSSVVSGLVVLLTLLVLTPLLKPLPYPALAAAIVMAVAALVRPGDLIATWRVRRSDACFGALTLVVTLLAAPDMVVGMALGIGLSVGMVLLRIMRPRCVIVAPDASGRWSATDPALPIAERRHQGRLVIRVDGRLGFLNATPVGNRIRDWLEHCPRETGVVLYACAINDIDSTGCDLVGELADLIQARGASLILADVKAPVRRRLEAHPRTRSIPIVPRVEAPPPPIAAVAG